MAEVDLFAPLSTLQWVDRDALKPNDYNPNKVNRENLKLLVQSILTNGWTLPIVVRPDYTIIDGFHRWTVAGEEPLHTKLQGKVPVVVVRHEDASEDIYGTVTHNRARGTHLLEPMKAIVKRLLDEGKSVQEIGKQLGMRPEEVFRLSDFSRDDFLSMMTKGVKGYSHADTEINFVKEISAKAHGDGYMSFSSNFWLDFVTVWGVIRLNLEPTQKADCISRIFIPKIDSPAMRSC